MTAIPIRRALLSVWDKTGLPELARALHEAGAELVSTGNTATAIEAAGLPVTRVEDLTGFPECLDGRVKTLHPRVHAGLLADTQNPDHSRQLTELGIEPFQLLVSTLYPFEQTVASGADHDAIIEKIDIGGPAMVRAAAKNHGSLAVITDIAQYGEVRNGHRRRRLHAGAAPPPRGPGLRPHGRLRRGGVLLVRRQLRTGRYRQGDRLAGPRRPGVDPRRDAALRREPAPAGGALQVKVNSRISPNGRWLRGIRHR